MKIKDLEAFRAVMSTGSTQAAAELLGISQSAVSRRLTQLESDFEQELFFRDGSRLMPSRINGLLEPRIADVLERVSMLQQAVNDLKTGRFSEALLRVAVPPGISKVIMPKIIADFLRENPEARFEVLHGTYNVIERMLEEKQAEIGFLRLPFADKNLHSSELIRARSVCAIPIGHRLTSKDVIRPSDLHNEPLVMLGRGRPPRHDIDLTFSSNGLAPHIRLEAHSVSSACGFAAQGIGIALVNSLLIRDCEQLEIAIRPFVPDIPHHFAFAFPAKPELPEMAKHFIEHAVGALKSFDRELQ
ncbi:LysR substrate-binding domain-containing protein [Brucella cytisi]|nr:LysR substrate-binding domain-containing protein [Brucella cytisi]